jgi:2-succinyl-5-enolpyruvyl-6-hydroxy-3-cyclohexene-1-carboxylate synthase
VRVLLVNNGGGGEFRLYTHAAAGFGESANRHIAAGGHFGSARGWVESMGWNYASVDSPGDLAGGLDKLVGESDVPMLLEVFTTMEQDSEGVRLMRETNGPRTLKNTIKRKVPPSVRRAVKRRIPGL